MENKSKKKTLLFKISLISFIAWVVIIGLFFVLSTFFYSSAKVNGGFYTPNEGKTFVVTVGLGVIAFLVFISTILLKIMRKIKNITKVKNKKKVNPFILGFVLLLIIGLLIGSVKAYKTMKGSSHTEDQSTTLQSQPIEVTPQATATPKVLGVKVIPPAQQSDLTNCTSPQCGNKSMTKTQCQEVVCCEINSTWYWTNSSSECKDKQNAYWTAYYASPSNTPVYRYTPPTITPLTLPTPQMTASPATIAPVNNTALLQNCLSTAQETYQYTVLQNEKIARGNGSGNSSSVEYENQKALNVYQNSIANCHSRYGN